MPNSKVSRTTPETQARKRWTPPTGVLGDLVERANRRAKELEAGRPDLRRSSPRSDQPRFAQAIAGNHVSIVAEVKKASPSRGAINPTLSVDQQVRDYASGGARAISVLTEPDLFGGCDDDLRAARSAVQLPILRKDFHVSPIQLFEARSLGASAALVIARAFDRSALAEMVAAARDADIEALVEVRDEDELDAALAAGAAMIGVNNRDLESLVVDPDTVRRIIPRVPADLVAIAESGYGSRASIEEAARAGADAVLIGSYLSASNKAAALLDDLVTVPRVSRSSVTT